MLRSNTPCLSCPWVVAILVFLIAAAGATTILWRFEQDRLQIERVHVSNYANHHAHMIERHIERTLSATYALAALVRQGNGAVLNFEALAHEMLPFYPGVSALGLAPGGIVQYVAPLAGNEQVIGQDDLKKPERNKEAMLARDTGQLTLAGPFPLVQGGLGAIGRLPVFLNDDQGHSIFWGFCNVLLRFPQALEPAQMSHLVENGFDYELWRIHPDTRQKQVIASSSPTPLVAPVEQTLEAPNATWTLSVSPMEGWSQPRWLTFQATIGLLFALLLAGLAKILIELKTHKKHLETLAAEVKTREEDLTEAQSVARIGSWVLDLTRNDLRWSEETYRLFGVPKGVLMDYSGFLEIVHPDDRAKVDQAWQAALNGAPYDIKHRIVVDGMIRWLHERARLEFDADGTLRRGVGTVQDITERKQIEEALKQSEERYRGLAEDMPVLICQYLPDSTLTYVNQAYAAYFGQTPDTLIGRRFLDFLPMEAAQAARNFYLSLTPDAPSRSYQHPVTVDGVVRWHEWTDRAFFNDHGEFTHFQAIGQDITERKRTEVELRIAAAAFESQEGIVITDAAQLILRVNRAFTLITGYSAEDAIGQTPSILKSGRHNAAFFAAMWAHLQQHEQWQDEIWNRRPNGEVYPVWLTITAVKDEHGTVTHYVGMLTDITQRKIAEDEIKHLALYDPLTELPNRRLLLDRLHQATTISDRNQQHGALLFIDLDNFKILNDTFGHDYGDLLLQQVAQRLATGIRESDTVARLGGDEFVVLLEGLSENRQEAATQTRIVGEKILTLLNSPYQLADHEHHSTSSIGVTLFNHHQERAEQLLKQADLAMYAAKAAGRNTLRFFEANYSYPAPLVEIPLLG